VRRLLVIALAVLVLAPVAQAGAPLASRRAVPADDISKPGATEWWHLLLFDPGSRSYVRVVFMSRPWVDFHLDVMRPGQPTMDIAGGAMGIVPQASPGVAMVGTSPPPGQAPPRASLAYVGGRYVVDASSGVSSAHLEIVPKVVGPTVGPWHLGPLQVTWNPDTFRPGTRMWSVPVAAGTASGWLDVNGTRVTVSGWRAYHDHTWGDYSLAAASWYHSDFAVVSPRPGEAWIVNGLQPGDGGYRTEPDDRAWQGVLVHAAGKRVVTCQARVARSAWIRATNSGDGWIYYLPNQVRASCSRRTGSFAFRPDGGFRGVGGFGIAQEVSSSAPTPGGTGWIAHAMPPLPNT
jgi:hypothetical protein